MRHHGSRAVQTLAVLSLILWTACGDGDGSAGPAPDESIEFTDLRAEGITATSAMVRFNTSRLTTCEAQYGVVHDVFQVALALFDFVTLHASIEGRQMWMRHRMAADLNKSAGGKRA